MESSSKRQAEHRWSRVGIRDLAFRPNHVTPMHEHEAPFFCVIVGGCSEQRSGGVTRERGLGQVFFYPAGEAQSERFGPKGGHVFAVDLLQHTGSLPSKSSELTGCAAVLARRLLRAARSADDLASLEVDESAMSIVGMLTNESRSGVAWLGAAREYVHANFREKVTLDGIARAANVHPVHLSRAFPRHFGRTLGDYIRGLRLDFAARELLSTNRPIVDIALDAGFASQAHLTRHFTERIGIPPAAYRVAR